MFLTYLWDWSIWKRHLCLQKKKLKGDWTRLLSVTFKSDQTDLFNTNRASWLQVNPTDTKRGIRMRKYCPAPIIAVAATVYWLALDSLFSNPSHFHQGHRLIWSYSKRLKTNQIRGFQDGDFTLEIPATQLPCMTRHYYVLQETDHILMD